MPEKPKKPPRVALWCAVSSKPQAAEDKASLGEQERLGREYAERRGGAVVRVYRVPGHSRDVTFWSEAAAAMPAYARLRADCEAGAFDVLVVYDPDRLGRDPALAHQVVSLVVKSGAALHVLDGDYRIDEDASVPRYLFAWQAERGGEEQKRRTHHHHFGMRARVKKGWPAFRWPYGYRARTDGAGKVVGGEPVEGEAGAVRLITRMFLEGAGYPAIARSLNASPWRPRRAERWSAESVRYMMLSDFYAGYPSFAEARPDEPSGKYEPLWDADTWRAVRRERARRRRGGKAPASPVTSCVFCARCGYRMTVARWRGNMYFRCSKHAKASATGERCHSNGIREAEVVAAVERVLDLLAGGAADLAAYVARAGAGRAEAEREVTERVREVERVKEQWALLARKVRQGVIDDWPARQENERLRKDLAAAEALLHGAEARLGALPDPQERRAAVEAALARGVKLTMAHRPLLVRAGLRVLVEEGEIVRVELGAY